MYSICKNVCKKVTPLAYITTHKAYKKLTNPLPPCPCPYPTPPPSGEVGFRAMSESLGWAKNPMLDRVHQLPPSMPLTMLYGARSWVDSSSGDRVVQIRNQVHTKVLVSRVMREILSN